MAVPSKPLSFFDLPPELRDGVYGLLLGDAIALEYSSYDGRALSAAFRV